MVAALAAADPDARNAIWVVMAIVIAVAVVLFVRQELRSRRRIPIARPRGHRPRVPRTAAPVPEIDPTVVFTDGARIGDARVRVARIAQLHLPTGQIVACDPLVNPDTEAFARAVPAGDYPVDVSVARLGDEDRVASIRVVLAEGTPVRWELATLPGQDVATLEDGESFGYGVDAGLGCFMDASTRALLLERGDALGADQNYFDDVLAGELGGDWADHRPLPDRAGNCVIVCSGWGDGIYSSFWGLDAEGRALCLVTDFGVVGSS